MQQQSTRIWNFRLFKKCTLKKNNGKLGKRGAICTHKTSTKTFLSKGVDFCITHSEINIIIKNGLLSGKHATNNSRTDYFE